MRTDAEEMRQVNAYYFGNSFLENSMPGLHGALGKSAGKEWNVTASIYAGIPIWCHMNYLTVKPRLDDLNKFNAAAPKCDTIVMLIYGGHGLSHVSKGYWGMEFPQPTDIGDINACATIIDMFLKHNPNGRAFIYTAWPGIPEAASFRKRVKDEVAAGARAQGLSREETLKLVKERKPTHAEMEPIRQRFDYAEEWMTGDYIPESATVEQRDRLQKYATALRLNPKTNPKPSTTIAGLAEATGIAEATVAADLSAVRIAEKDLTAADIATRVGQYVNEWPHTHSRAHMWAVMEGLKKRYPAMWQEGRLGIIPHGDVFLALDKKMRAGQVPGVVNVGEYSTDGGHIRAGLPRYTLAATCYAVLFRDNPNHLDWKLMADRDDYVKDEKGLNKVGGVYTHIPDLGEVLEITPERAKAVNDTIWEFVQNHPYTQVSK
jgi:hypothetical protein